MAIRSLIYNVRINPIGLDWRRFRVVVSPGGDLLGCGQIKLHGKGLRELASIAVKDKYRGKGIARVVIESLLEYEPERPLYLMCRSRLNLFYEQFGFQAMKIEEMPPYFRRINQMERIINIFAHADRRLSVMRLV